MNRICTVFLSGAFLLTLSHTAFALLYLPENSLESLLVRSDAVVIGKIAAFSEKKNTGSVDISDALKGEAKGHLNLTSAMLRVTSKESRPRFAAGETVILFLGPEAPAGRPVLHSQTLEGDAEVKTMKACVAEITPFATTLADLPNPKKPLDEKALRQALEVLTPSKNAYTQILVGRLMGTSLAKDVKPDAWQGVLLAALASKREELAHGAMLWTAQFERLPDPIRAALIKITTDSKDEALIKEAKALLEKNPQ